MDVFAADLWDTFKNRGSEEYNDPKTFFRKTHITKNLQAILDNVQNRLQGKGGDGFQHIETPFGGGKTHAMIALYHSAKQWGAKQVVIVGTSMSPDDTVWGMIEKQLDGKIDKLSGKLAPGREKLRDVLEKHSSVLILVDELFSHVSVGAGIKVEGTTLAKQTITFMQQLSEAISGLDRVCVVASFPASVYEMADKASAEELLLQLRKVAGRKEKKITPIDPDDVPNIIRARLFSTSESDIKRNAEEIISDFVDYCERESILPPKSTAKQYRERFEQTYPFLPQVIDALYQNWGSFPSFQRTRGVLRLLSLVVYSLRDSERPYITLSDFDLKDNEIRRELLGHIGDKFDSVIAKDITDPSSGAVRAEQDVGSTYKGLCLGIKTATAIFMYSFSGGGANGATMNQIKRAASNRDMHSSVIGDVVATFKSKLSYFKSENDRYLFSSEPNINRLRIDKMENITEQEVRDNEKILLESNIGGGGGRRLRTSIWPSNARDVEDSPTLKLVILSEDDQSLRESILENKGDGIPRIYRNSIFFLCPPEAERKQFVKQLKGMIALQQITSDSGLQLKDEQKTDIKNALEKEKAFLPHAMKKYYRNLYVPTQTFCEMYDMGIPTMGESSGIPDRVFERLASEQQIHEKIGALVLKDEYLKHDKFARTASMYPMMLSTRGSRRPTDRDVIEDSIIEGVKNGTFGLGELIDEKPSCKFFQDDSSVAFADNEIIIHDTMCTMKPTTIPSTGPELKPSADESNKPSGNITSVNAFVHTFDVPEGRLNDAWGIMRLLNEKFKSIRLGISAKDGSMTDADVKRIRETLEQMGVEDDSENDRGGWG